MESSDGRGPPSKTPIMKPSIENSAIGQIYFAGGPGPLATVVAGHLRRQRIRVHHYLREAALQRNVQNSWIDERKYRIEAD